MTRNGFKTLCKALNIRCTELLSFEAMICCRGPKMDESDPDEFNFEKLVQFVDYKSKFLPPADNPRIAMKRSNTRDA